LVVVLSIGKLVLGQQRYYEQQVAHGADDYYTGRGEAAGEWLGAGASELGLTGRVSADQFNALLEGRDPRAPERRLRAGVGDPQVVALDLTFSAPKSVSVLFAVAPAEVASGLVDCHEQAVRAALGWLEGEAVFVRRGQGGHRFEHAGGLIAAAYRHRMSRSLDPQLHTHVVAANLARGRDGRFTALHHPSLYRAAKTAGYLYQSHLRSLVRDRLGFEWGPVRKGAAEIQGLPAEVLRLFSQRRAQVEAAVAEREAELGRTLTTAERSTWGAIATRDRKQYGIDSHTWREEITARAAEHGLDRELIERIAADGLTRVERRTVVGEGALEQAGERVTLDELGGLLAGPIGLTERANTFDEPMVLRAFAAASTQGARVATVRDQGDWFLARADVLGTVRESFTSSNLVVCERALIDHALRRAGSRVAQLDVRAVRNAVGTGGRALNAGQEAAVRAVATSGNGVDVIEALAGTGKTHTAGALRELYERAGYQVLGVAPTGRAARELNEQAGIPSRTLDSRLRSIENGNSLPEQSVVIFDEAAMAPTRLSERLLAHAAQVGAKVIALGDPGQLRSIQAGGWMAAIARRLGAARLTEVVRQRDPAERLALAALHDGHPQRWLRWATANGRLEVIPDGARVLEHAIAQWAIAVDAHGVDQSVLIARDGDTRYELNELAREQRRDSGMLGEERSYGPVTVAVGDRVICRNNDRDLDVDNGTRGTVCHLDNHHISVETDAHLIRTLPAAYVADHVEHAYALTGHGMQGTTVEHAIVVASPHDLSRGWSYTALSRARGHTQLVIRDTTATPASRDEFAPTARAMPSQPPDLLVRVARRMLERDDEDLALDQLPAAAGRADDAELARTNSNAPAQERAAERAAPQEHEPAPPLSRIFEQLEDLRAQLHALPTRELDRLDELDARARTLTEQHERLRDELDRLPAPRHLRLGRGGDSHIVDRTRLISSIEGARTQLDRTLAERAALGRRLGDPGTIREERDGLINAAQALRRAVTQQRNELADRELVKNPAWAREALGERPKQGWERDRWDHAARTIARYRIEHDITDTHDPLGPPPSDAGQRADHERAQQVREQLAHELGRDPPSHELELS
jgi:conjugative relaxase-like TrwC/TraI family protein